MRVPDPPKKASCKAGPNPARCWVPMGGSHGCTQQPSAPMQLPPVLAYATLVTVLKYNCDSGDPTASSSPALTPRGLCLSFPTWHLPEVHWVPVGAAPSPSTLGSPKPQILGLRLNPSRCPSLVRVIAEGLEVLLHYCGVTPLYPSPCPQPECPMHSLSWGVRAEQ